LAASICYAVATEYTAKQEWLAVATTNNSGDCVLMMRGGSQPATIIIISNFDDIALMSTTGDMDSHNNKK
jgi:hypothetical protein